MFVLVLVGAIVSGWLHLELVIGLTFLAGCLVAALCTKRQGLLIIAAAPPLIFAIAILSDQVFTAPGSTLKATAESVAAGTFLTLAATAPWLLAGVFGTVAIVMFRGLPRCFSELRSQLRTAAGPQRRG
jgi:hypothetical protein